MESNKDKYDVLLSNGWDRISYNILRGLSKENLKVAFGTDNYFGMGYFSKYAAAKFIHHNYKKSEELFIADIISAINNYYPDVYIPTGEEIFAVSRNKKKIEQTGVKLPVSDIQTLETLNNKTISFKIAEKAGIPVPLSIVPRNMDEIHSFIRQEKLPVIIKKDWSRAAQHVIKITEENFKNINRILSDHKLSFGNFIVQKFVEGTTYGVSLLMNQGDLRAKFTHKRLRERIITGGPSTLRVSVNNQLLEEYALRLLSSVKFHGVAMIEFKYDERTKQGWFIEANPRFWGSVGLAINSGVNFPYLLYKMAVEGDVEPVNNYEQGIVTEWWLGDKLVLLKNHFSTKGKLRDSSYKKKVDYFDDFYKDDPLPFFAWMFLLLRRKFVKLK
ncbi:ATP-grasp domain-containing protein [Ignavibacterium sp.]|uniref:carboxylate--amine ligase n=1 Tax=Ignavibacterium sp. TaxID=2651167 RepID=UPI00307E23F4